MRISSTMGWIGCSIRSMGSDRDVAYPYSGRVAAQLQQTHWLRGTLPAAVPPGMEHALIVQLDDDCVADVLLVPFEGFRTAPDSPLPSTSEYRSRGWLVRSAVGVRQVGDAPSSEQRDEHVDPRPHCTGKPRSIAESSHKRGADGIVTTHDHAPNR